MLITTTTRALTMKAKLFRGFADPSRLAILEALREGPLNVTELVTTTGLSQPNVSNHLNCLFDCDLVFRSQKGRYVYYALSDARVAALLKTADEVLADVAMGMYACTRYNRPEGE